MDESQKKLARHALGLSNRNRRSYRNHFVCGPGHDDFEQWRSMVEAGFANRRAGDWRSGGDDIFWLTRAGADRALEPGETLCPEHFPLIGAH